MEEYGSKSCRDGRMHQMGSYDENKAASSPPTNMQYLRCHSANYAGYMGKEVKLKKSKSAKHHPNHGHGSSSLSFNDPELQRKKRVASYKVYAVERRMKGSLRKNVRWIKNTYTQVIHGWW